jgi:2-keto-4-pentenoate hydratase
MTPAGTSIGWQLSETGAIELTESMVLTTGSTLASSDTPVPQVAPQIMFLLREDIGGPGLTAAGVCAATSVLAGLAVTADDGGTVPGVRFAAHALPCDFDLSLVGALLELGGDVVATAAGAAISGHPAEAVARFANERAAAGGGPLRRGQIIGSGLLVEPRPVTGPGEAAAVFGRLGTVSLAVV